MLDGQRLRFAARRARVAGEDEKAMALRPRP